MELHGPLSICKMESQVREHPGSPKRKAKGSPSQIQKDIDIYIYIYIFSINKPHMLHMSCLMGAPIVPNAYIANAQCM
jgi:hypothetical protein